jgi:acetylornithine/N-succinyldiaminopimelate aminotransferase
VRGWGLLQGIVIRESSSWTAPALAKAAIDHGLLLVAAGPSVLRMVPPLTINKQEIRELLRRLAATLSSVS